MKRFFAVVACLLFCGLVSGCSKNLGLTLKVYEQETSREVVIEDGPRPIEGALGLAGYWVREPETGDEYSAVTLPGHTLPKDEFVATVHRVTISTNWDSKSTVNAPQHMRVLVPSSHH